MPTKLEVQVRHCFCCGLTPGTFLIGLYSLLLYALLTGLAAVALSDTAWNGDKPIYEGCELEAQGKRDLRIQSGQIIVEDSSTYHCSFGMYTEEMKFSQELRYLVLLIDLCLYVPLIIASLTLLVGVCLNSPWLLLPWLILMPFDVLRGLISSILILLMSHGLLARIATGIFFLGLQFLHISLWILILAKFLRLRYGYGHQPAAQTYYESRQTFSQPQQPYPADAYYGGGPSAVNYTYSPQSGRRMPIDEFGMNAHGPSGAHNRQQPAPNQNYDGPARY